MNRKPQKNLKHNSGAILIISLWILSILVVFAVGLSHRLFLQIRLVEAGIDSQKAYYAAMAGIHRAIAEKEHPDAFEGIFEDIDKPWDYSIQDEQARIDINKASFKDLKYLLIAYDMEPSLAESTAAAIIDWRDEDSEAYNGIGAEDLFYETKAQPYQCKDAPFDSIEELILVNGITSEFFYGKDSDGNGIIKDITVFGEDKINVNTASAEALKAILEDPADTETIVRRIITYRQGADGITGTSDDGVFSRQDSGTIFTEFQGFSTDECSRLNALGFSTATSTYRINSSAQEEGIKRAIEAVVQLRDSEKPVIRSWRML